jgi:hypothetical protein
LAVLGVALGKVLACGNSPHSVVSLRRPLRAFPVVAVPQEMEEALPMRL